MCDNEYLTMITFYYNIPFKVNFIIRFAIHYISKETKSEARYTHLKNLIAPDYILPLKTNPTWGLRDVFFTPGLHLVGDKLAFVKQMPMFETPTIGI